MWLNDRRNKDVILSVDLDHSPGWLPLLNGRATLGHSSDSFELKFVQENADLASMYPVGPFVLSVDELDRFRPLLVTTSEYDQEFVEVEVCESVRLTIGDPL